MTVLDALRTLPNVLASESEAVTLGWRFDLADGDELQDVRISLANGAGGTWIVITAAAGPIDDFSPIACMRRNARLAAGVLAFTDDMLIVRHTLPLAAGDPAEVQTLARMVALEAARQRVLSCQPVTCSAAAAEAFMAYSA